MRIYKFALIFIAILLLGYVVAAQTASPEPPAVPPTSNAGMKIRETIENNIGLAISAIAVTAFMLGFGAYKAILVAANLDSVHKGTYMTAKEVDQGFISKDKFNDLLRENKDLRQLSMVQATKKVELVSFALNEEDCYFKAVSPPEYGYLNSEVFGGPFYEPTPEYHDSVYNLGGNQTVDAYEKLYPVFDATFLNHNETEVVLNAVEVAILQHLVPQGDGPSGEQASVLDVTHRYLIDLVEITIKQKRTGDFVLKNLYPPVRIPAGKPARVQFGLYVGAEDPWEDLSSTEGLMMFGTEQTIRLRFVFHFSGNIAVSSGMFEITL